MSPVVRRALRQARTRSGLALAVVLGAVALFAPALTPYDPVEHLDPRDGALLGPSVAHPFGTDDFSRDMFSRIVFGARVSLTIAVVSVLIAISAGTAVGSIAGLAGGAVDAVLMRVVDALLAVPRIFLVLLVVALWDRVEVVTLILILGLTSWFATSRVVRAEVLSVREREYIGAARALGLGRMRLFFRHVLPNIAAPIVVSATLGVGHMILVEAGLSYLGVGVRPPTPSWGNIIRQGQEWILPGAWWISLFPGIAIVITVVAFSLIGDGLRDALDPRAR
jgi:peptide/nickel transport system permease protein